MRAALNRDVPRALVLNREHIERTAQKVAKAMANFAFAPAKSANDRQARAWVAGRPRARPISSRRAPHIIAAHDN